MSLMSRIYLDALAVAAQMVHAERKALAYLFGKPSDAPLSALNVATVTIFNRCILDGLQPAECHMLDEQKVQRISINRRKNPRYG